MTSLTEVGFLRCLGNIKDVKGPDYHHYKLYYANKSTLALSFVSVYSFRDPSLRSTRRQLEN